MLLQILDCLLFIFLEGQGNRRAGFPGGLECGLGFLDHDLLRVQFCTESRGVKLADELALLNDRTRRDEVLDW